MESIEPTRKLCQELRRYIQYYQRMKCFSVEEKRLCYESEVSNR